ncbi:MarR family winged helix-turn-helix transcriptional regulator [Deinococcus sp.]|uniref:MarR family winged helix-turn-helix transcriptional regulator n=1 Tax=Deinococcus sp. TaxID=47478 RepID=UPI003B5B67E1
MMLSPPSVLPARPPEVQLWVTLDRVYTQLSRNVTGKLSTMNLTAPQFRVLRQLSQSDTAPRTASELAAILGVTPGNLTGILDRLEHEGLLSRQRGQDRRSLQVAITPQGEERMRRAVPEMHGHLRELFSGLNAAEVAQMKALLERLELQLNSPAEEQSA